MSAVFAELAAAERLLRAEKSAHSDTREALACAVRQLKAATATAPHIAALPEAAAASGRASEDAEAVKRAERRALDAEGAARTAAHREKLVKAEATAWCDAARAELLKSEGELRLTKLKLAEQSAALEDARRDARTANQRAQASKSRTQALDEASKVVNERLERELATSVRDREVELEIAEIEMSETLALENSLHARLQLLAGINLPLLLQELSEEEAARAKAEAARAAAEEGRLIWCDNCGITEFECMIWCGMWRLPFVLLQLKGSKACGRPRSKSCCGPH